MSEIVTGQVVCVRKGRGKGRFYAVMGMEKGLCLLCNGEDRPLSHPKGKNPLHLRKTRVCLVASCLKTDKQLQAALQAFSCRKNGSEGEPACPNRT